MSYLSSSITTLLWPLWGHILFMYLIEQCYKSYSLITAWASCKGTMWKSVPVLLLFQTLWISTLCQYYPELLQQKADSLRDTEPLLWLGCTRTKGKKSLKMQFLKPSILNLYNIYITNFCPMCPEKGLSRRWWPGDSTTRSFHCLRGTGWARNEGWVWSQGWVRSPAVIQKCFD